MSILETQHFINGKPIRPVNADEILFRQNWDDNAEEAELSIDNIELATEAKMLIQDHIENGQGVFEGIPYSVQIVSDQGTLSLEYYIDLTENPRISGFGDSQMDVTIKKRRAIDKFRNECRGLSFESLNTTHPITTVDIAYLIIKDNQAVMLITLFISAYTLTKALIEGVRELIVAITDFIKITFVGTGVAVGQIIAAALLLIARIAYVAALILALIELTKQIIEIIFPPVRYLKAATVKELLTKGCTKLGYTFVSSMIDEFPQETILPIPLKEDQKSIFTNLFTLDNGSYTKGYPTARDTTPLLEDLFQAMEARNNAKRRVIGNTVYLERRDFWELHSGLVIRRTLNLQPIRENQWGYNTSEAWKRYVVRYQTDPSDLNTLDAIDSTATEYSTEPISTTNADLVNIKGNVDVNIPFAIGVRKAGYTTVEEFAIPFAKLADEVVQFFGGKSDLYGKIKGRIGVLQLSQQYYTVTKFLYQKNGRQPFNYLQFIGADPVYQRYHTINQVKENFKRIYTEEIPFSTTDYQTLQENNYVTDENGTSIEILESEWTNEGKRLEVTYAVKSNEGFNTKTVLIN